MSASAHPPPGHAGPKAHRVIFIDLSRALAVFFMLYGHTVSALLAPQYQVGTWFDIWNFQRGLTSSLFMLLGGFAFSIATTRHWHTHTTWSWAVLKRLRRFGLFVLLGYSLHLPVDRLSHLSMATPENWRAFLNVDVLHLIGVTFIAVQLLVLLCRSRRVFMVVAFALAAAVVWATAPALRTDWAGRVPEWVAPYLSTRTGSLFPVLPWSGFVFLGAALGQLYARWGAGHLASFAKWALLAPGAILFVAAFASRITPSPEFFANPFSTPARDFIVRAGPCLMMMGAMAFASARMMHLPRMVAAAAQESLFIYFVHICIVYGSPWNPGLWKWYGAALGPAATLAAVAFVITATAALAYAWNHWKHAHPKTAKYVPWAVGVVLVGWIL